MALVDHDKSVGVVSMKRSDILGDTGPYESDILEVASL